MKMSEKKIMAVYAAIHSSLMSVRIEIKSGDIPLEEERIDLALFDLETTIWRKIEDALNI